MSKKTLEGKIKTVCWWALGLTILYFLIGAFLISDGNKFDSTKTYNLLKDTLTLTAGFLAPVAAFVLFSDWREQHRQVREEAEVFQNLNNIKADSRRLSEIFTEINNNYQFMGIQVVEKFDAIIEDEINKNEKNEINLEYILSNTNQADLYGKIRDLTLKQGRILRSIHILFNRAKKVEACKVNSYAEVDLPHRLTSEGEASLVFYERIECYFDNHLQALNDIEAIAKTYRI